MIYMKILKKGGRRKRNPCPMRLWLRQAIVSLSLDLLVSPLKKSSPIYLGPKKKSSLINLGPKNLLCNIINWVSRIEEQRRIMKKRTQNYYLCCLRV
jgi:hypothetical protein